MPIAIDEPHIQTNHSINQHAYPDNHKQHIINKSHNQNGEAGQLSVEHHHRPGCPVEYHEAEME